MKTKASILIVLLIVFTILVIMPVETKSQSMTLKKGKLLRDPLGKITCVCPDSIDTCTCALVDPSGT